MMLAHLQYNLVRQFFLDQRGSARPRHTSHALKWPVQREKSAEGDAGNRGGWRRGGMKTPARTHVRERGAKRPVCSRVEVTYQRLKRDIMEGVYTPRQRLIETDVAPLLGV